MRVRYSFSSRKTGRAREGKNLRKQKTKYPIIAQKIIDSSDIVLEILDSRFIEETRNLDIEKEIKRQGKILIYVMNKSDMIDKKKAKISPELRPRVFTSCPKREGIKSLRDLLKRHSKKIDKTYKSKSKFDEKIVVGILGYPNTGKSSLINLLIGKKSAGTGSDAGFTKGLQKLRLSSEIVLLDSPGVIPKEHYASIGTKALAAHTKLGARSFSQVKDPETVVANLMGEFPNLLQKYYGIKTESSEHLMEKLGRKWNFLKKGNQINFDQVSRRILKDWQEGKIRI